MNPPSTSDNVTDSGDASRKRPSAESIMQRALKQPQEFLFKNQIRFQTVKGHILPSVCRHEGKDENECPICRYEKQLKLPSLPEMIFDQNRLDIFVPFNSACPFISFDTFDALALVDHFNLPNVMVSSPFDWTYTSEYTGTLADGIRVEETNDKIDIEKLRRPDPLLFYDAIKLYEDELADNGCAEMTVKVRAMPTNYFVLCRFYLRVDRVLVRVFDCRLYSEENWNYVLRECTKREAKYADIKTEVSACRVLLHLRVSASRSHPRSRANLAASADGRTKLHQIVLSSCVSELQHESNVRWCIIARRFQLRFLIVISVLVQK
ncbi:TIP41-like protein [Aphelenchoides besseyi]|nr:TIP41-like protein [Aphelenchoides besseyi]